MPNDEKTAKNLGNLYSRVVDPVTVPGGAIWTITSDEEMKEALEKYELDID